MAGTWKDLTASVNSMANNLTVQLRVLSKVATAIGLTHAVQTLGPNVVLLDFSMPGHDPIDALCELSGVSPQTHGIVFSAHDDPEIVHTAIDSGARSFLVKDGSIDRVLAAIRAVAAG